MVYSKQIRKMYKEFTEKNNFKCSLCTFLKYKPFYITPPTEREKESCLCQYCANAHYLLKGINNYRKGMKLDPHTSVTDFLKIDILCPGFMDNDSYRSKTALYPEFTDKKAVNFYIFESKEETYFKDGIEKKYKRTTRVDKYVCVSAVVHQLFNRGKSYLIHRSHVKNISKVFPLMKELFNGRYIELDFSENLSLKPKFEIQAAHFSGRQYSLHCSIVEPGVTKFVFHLRDDTTHDASSVHVVLEDIFIKWGIKNEIVMIKSGNASAQYKDKYAFWSLQHLVDKYNCQIIRVHGAAGHGNGLIDAMSSFGVKAILKRDVIAFDQWFQNSKEICDYLAIRGDQRMMYAHVDEKLTNEQRCSRKSKVINGCMKAHLFVYKPNCEKILMREFLCDGEYCLASDFDVCILSPLVAAMSLKVTMLYEMIQKKSLN